MAAYEVIVPSGSTNGRPILIAAESAPGTTLHVAVNVAGQFDEVYVVLTNLVASAQTVTICMGGTAAKDLRTVRLDPFETGRQVVEGVRFNGGVTISAYATQADKVSATLVVNRITP